MAGIQDLRDAGFSKEEVIKHLESAGFSAEEFNQSVEDIFRNVPSSIKPALRTIPPTTQAFEQGALPPEFTPGERFAIEATRFGPPTLTALSGAGIFAEAPIVAGSEFAARRLEDYFRDPDTFDSLEKTGEQLKQGAFAGALDTVTFGITKGFSNLFRRIGRKALLPPDITPGRGIPGGIPKDVRTAMRTLDVLTPAGAAKPLTPTFGQLNRAEKNIVVGAESATRAAMFGKKLFARFDERNVVAVRKAMEDYVRVETKDQSTKQTVDFLERLLNGTQRGKISDATANAIRPVRALSSVKYDLVDELAANVPLIDGLPIQRFVKSRTNSIPARQAFERISKKVIPEVEGSVKILPALDDAQAWSVMTWQEVDGALRHINSVLPKMSRAERQFVQPVKERLTAALKGSFSGTPGLVNAYEDALSFYSQAADRILDNAVIEAVRKKIANSPGTVVGFFTKNANRLNNLQQLKKALSFSAGIEGGVPRFNEWWGENFIRPIRHHLITQTRKEGSDVIDADKFARMLDKLSDNGISPENISEVFGDVSGKQLLDFATTLKVIESRAGFEDVVWIKLLQGGAILGGITAATFSDDPTVTGLGAGTAAIFMLPTILAAFQTRPRLVKMLTDGLSAGPKSAAFARLVRTVAVMTTAEKVEISKLSPAAVDFYTRFTSPDDIIESESTTP